MDGVSEPDSDRGDVEGAAVGVAASRGLGLEDLGHRAASAEPRWNGSESRNRDHGAHHHGDEPPDGRDDGGPPAFDRQIESNASRYALREALGDPAFTVDDDTLVVAVTFRLVKCGEAR
jgi:hypothetical protein